MAYFKLEEPVRFHRYPFDFHAAGRATAGSSASASGK